MKEIINFISIYGTPIAIILGLIAFYNQYKKDQKLLNTENNEIEEKNSLKKYLKDVFILRPIKRPLISAIPQVGIIISLASLLIYPVWLYQEILNPIQSLKNLTKYNGKIIGYKYNRKSNDRLIVQLDNGEIKYFLSGVTGTKDYMDTKLNSKVFVLVQKERGFLENGEKIILIQYYSDDIDLIELDKAYENIRKYEKADIWLITTPLKFLLFFIFLLWLVNRNPIKSSLKRVNNGDN